MENNTNTRVKGSRLWMGLLGVITFAVLVSLILGILSFRQTQQLNALLRENLLNEKGETQEDDVKIANEYYIRSTTAISDAYLSGDTAKLDDKEKETLDLAAAVLKEIIQEGMTPFEKEKAVYDWMVANLQNDSGILTVIPTTQADCDNPYGVLKYHNAVCVGYATTFRLFMQMMEIPCKIVHNLDCYHSWDLVQLDGHWYHTDIYSDVGEGHYANFNMDDNLCSRGQEWDIEYFPAADSLEYNVANREAEEGCDAFALPKKVIRMLNEDKSFLSFRYGNDLTEEEAYLITQLLNETDERLRATEEYANYGVNYSFAEIKGGYLLSIYPSYYGDNEEMESVTEENREKMNKALDKAFKGLTPRASMEDWDEFDE